MRMARSGRLHAVGQRSSACGWPAAVVYGWPAAVVYGWPAAVVYGSPGRNKGVRLRKARGRPVADGRRSSADGPRSSADGRDFQTGRLRMARGRPRMAKGRLRMARGRLRMACSRFTVPDGRRGKLGWIRVLCALAGFRPLWSAARPWSCGSSVTAGLPTSTTVHSAHFQKKGGRAHTGTGSGFARVRVSVVTCIKTGMK